MNKLTKIPAWHAEAAGKLQHVFGGIHSLFLDATKKAVWLGLFLNAIKERGKSDKSIPHGQFRAWAAANLPDLHYDTITTYMAIGRGVIETGKLQITDYTLFARDGKLPEGVERLIEGKTQRQLLLEWKQCDQEGNPQPGRRPGEGGRRAMSIGEIADQVKQVAAKDWADIEKRLTAYSANFAYLEDDSRIEAQAGLLEKHLRARRAWLTTPAAKRDPASLKPLFQAAR